MMKHKTKQALSWLLSLALVCGLAPALGGTAGAADSTVSTESELRTALSASETGTVTLGGNIETSATLTVNGTKTLDLNGYGIRYNGSMGTDHSVIHLDSTDDNLTLTDSATETRYWKIPLDDDYRPTSISQGSADGYDVKGGYITGGYNSARGGGVYAQYGAFTMTGGTIYGNNAQMGGGIYSGLTDSDSGSAVKITISGTALITKNYATNGNGGGICFNSKNGTCNFSGTPRIIGNVGTGSKTQNNIHVGLETSEDRLNFGGSAD